MPDKKSTEVNIAKILKGFRELTEIKFKSISIASLAMNITFAQDLDTPEIIHIIKTERTLKDLKNTLEGKPTSNNDEENEPVMVELTAKKFKSAMCAAIKVAEEKDSEQVVFRVDERDICINLTLNDANAIMFLF